MKSLSRYAVTVCLISLIAGCAKWNPDEAPDGFAVIREHVIDAPRNEPPIKSLLDFTIIEIDGKPVTRETVPPWVDMQLGALVTAGNHELKASVSPHARPLNYRPTEAVFKVNVQSKKVYFLVDNRNGEPVLIEAKSRQK